MQANERLPNIHPGEVLCEEFLIPLGLSQYALAKAIGVPALRISQICAGKRAIMADTALRLGRFFNTSEGFWLGLQVDFDLEAARLNLGGRLESITPLNRAA